MARMNAGWVCKLARIAARVAAVFLIAFVVGWLLNRIEAALEKNQQPAGFGRGMLQGALMPMSMPNLFVGHDITIYSVNNTGVTYKLGYTAGVNLCGVLFFGLMFWRLTQWRGIKNSLKGEETVTVAEQRSKSQISRP